MTNLTGLQEIYVALGGSQDTAATLTNNAEALHAIAGLIPAVTSAELPAVTAADNGKVLKVVSGEWAVGTDATA